MKNDIFWSEIGSGFGELGGTHPPRIPRNTPPELRRREPWLWQYRQTYFLFPIWYLVDIHGGGTISWDHVLFAVGLWQEPLNNYLVRRSRGRPASFLVLSYDTFSCVCNSFHTCCQQGGAPYFRFASNRLSPWEGGGGEVEGTAQSFIRGSNPRTKPLPFYIPYLSRKRYPSCISSIDKWYPFHRSRTLHPYNLRQKWYFWQCSITEQTEIAILAVWTEWLGQLGGTVNSFPEVYLVVCCKFE